MEFYLSIEYSKNLPQLSPELQSIIRIAARKDTGFFFFSSNASNDLSICEIIILCVYIKRLLRKSLVHALAACCRASRLINKKNHISPTTIALLYFKFKIYI